MRSRRITGVLLVLTALSARPVRAAPDWDPWGGPPAGAVTAPGSVTAPAVLLGQAAIRAYQWLLSPALGGRCQFDPSCSRYAFACMGARGFLPGMWRGADRISRCHGFADLGGYPEGADGRLLDAPGP